MANNALLAGTGLAALLRDHGFAGSAPTFRKVVGKVTVFVVNVQTSARGSQIKLGVHLKYLGKTDWPAVKALRCAFHARLRDIAGGETFFFDDAASVSALLEMMKLEGLLWFGNFEPDQLESTVRYVAKHVEDKLAPLGESAGPITWSRVANHLGDAASEKRLIARANQHDRDRLAADAMRMTSDEYRAAKASGTARRAAKLVD